MRPKTIHIRVFFLLMAAGLQAQITFNACNPLLENQDYTFNALVTPDTTGRNVFETDPISGDQDCGGVGVCEMRIAWSMTNNRWEIYADDGNGTFANTYVLYFNSEASTPNPPSTILGVWTENTTVTNSLCGNIVTLTGDVQDSTLNIEENQLNNLVRVYPNPVDELLIINFSESISISTLIVYDVLGNMVINKVDAFETLDVSELNSGFYFIKIKTDSSLEVTKKIIVE